MEDLVRLALTRSGPEVEDPIIVLPLLAATLHTLESEDFQETDLSPVNDLTQKVRPSDPDAPSDTVTEELASRGLGHHPMYSQANNTFVSFFFAIMPSTENQ